MRVPEPLAFAAATKRFSMATLLVPNPIPDVEVGVAKAELTPHQLLCTIHIEAIGSTEKEKIKLGKVDRLRGNGGGRPVGIVRARYHSGGGGEAVHVGRKGERAGARERRWQRILEVKFLVALGGLG